MFRKLKGRLCFLLIRIYRRYFVPSPEIDEIVHYSYCPNCGRYIQAQGWVAEFKEDENEEIYEVTFRAQEPPIDRLTQKLKERPKASFYV